MVCKGFGEENLGEYGTHGIRNEGTFAGTECGGCGMADYHPVSIPTTRFCATGMGRGYRESFRKRISRFFASICLVGKSDLERVVFLEFRL